MECALEALLTIILEAAESRLGCNPACLLAGHKERVTDLLARVATVSVETVRITTAMQALLRTDS